eukprot:6450500-Amphidinium_carterae.1
MVRGQQHHSNSSSNNSIISRKCDLYARLVIFVSCLLQCCFNMLRHACSQQQHSNKCEFE